MNSVKSNHTHHTRKTIFVFLGHRLNITDTLHTRFIKELSQKHRVVVFLPTEIGGIQVDMSTYPKLKNVSYHLIPAPIGRFWCFSSELRSEFITRFNNTFLVKWNKYNTIRIFSLFTQNPFR